MSCGPEKMGPTSGCLLLLALIAAFIMVLAAAKNGCRPAPAEVFGPGLQENLTAKIPRSQDRR